MKTKLILGAITVGLFSCGPSKAELLAREQHQQDSSEQALLNKPANEQNVFDQAIDTVSKTIEINANSETRYKIITIDQCEYILWPQTYKYWNEWANHTKEYVVFVPIHKANCTNSFHNK